MGSTKKKYKRKFSYNKKTDSISIIALAYLHRYGWIVIMLGLAYLFHEARYYILMVSSILYSIWTFLGYRLKWKHIFCSYQNANRKKMTPNAINWNWVDKKDAYGVPLFFLLAGVAGSILAIL